MVEGGADVVHGFADVSASISSIESRDVECRGTRYNILSAGAQRQSMPRPSVSYRAWIRHRSNGNDKGFALHSGQFSRVQISKRRFV